LCFGGFICEKFRFGNVLDINNCLLTICIAFVFEYLAGVFFFLQHWAGGFSVKVFFIMVAAGHCLYLSV
jgi:hypothetical protein